MKKITVRLVGGLGNQLHCYAFGRAVAGNSDTPLEVDVESGYWNDPYGRKYMLDAFPALNINKKKLPKTGTGRFIFRAKLKFGAALLSKLPLEIRPIVREGHPRGYREDVHRKRYKINPYFMGYWASYRYYQDIAEDLRRDLVPPRPHTPAAICMLKEITSARSCFIHWRSYAEEIGVPHPSLAGYYHSAVYLIERKYPGIRFFIFSDDVAAARKELMSLGDKMIFVDIPEAGDQCLNDFYLMYSCGHAIVSDSTFSWWAAWLGDRKTKTVTAPRGLSPWGEDWTPPHWITVDT